MGEATKIEWCDHTFNGWIGCTKVGPGCDHCYAESMMDHRYGRVQWGAGNPRVRTSDTNWRKPLAWNKAAEGGPRPRVFCASLADVFDNEVPDQWRSDLWRLIQQTPNLDWLLLTKRIGNAHRMLPAFMKPYPNLWLGATVVNQEEANRDVLKLLDTPANVRFLSCEPLLGPLDLTRIELVRDNRYMAGIRVDALRGRFQESDVKLGTKLDWVIAGGESGPNARPAHPEWIRSLRDQCVAAGVPFHFKQWGEWVAVNEIAGHAPHHYFYNGTTVRRVGKKTAGRLLDGRTWDEFPGHV